jgi:hypothetical protein
MAEILGETAMTEKLTVLESAMPGVDTVMGMTGFAVATRETGMAAVNWVALTNVVTSGACAHWTVEPWTKRSPVTVRVTAGPPEIADVGLRLMIVVPYGSGRITKLMGLEAVAPGFFIETATMRLDLPSGLASCTRAAGTVAYKTLELRKRVTSGAPFHRTWAPLTKFVPPTPKVRDAMPGSKDAMPAYMMLGLIALTEANDRVMVRVWETALVVGSVTNKDTV